MTLENWQWQNPEMVLQRKQEANIRKVQQCGKCVNVSMIFNGQPKCTVRKQTFGYRCEFYKEASND